MGGCDATRRANPAERMESIEAVQRLLDLLLGNESLVEGRDDDCQRNRVDADLVGRQFDCQVVGQGVQSGLGDEYVDDGIAATAWCAHMLPMLTMAPLRPPLTITRTAVWVRKKIARSSSR
jgi:hypothetical protein